MAKKLENPTVIIEIEVSEDICPQIDHILEKDSFQAKLDIIDWYRAHVEDGTDLQPRIYVKIPRR